MEPRSGHRPAPHALRSSDHPARRYAAKPAHASTRAKPMIHRPVHAARRIGIGKTELKPQHRSIQVDRFSEAKRSIRLSASPGGSCTKLCPRGGHKPKPHAAYNCPASSHCPRVWSQGCQLRAAPPAPPGQMAPRPVMTVAWPRPTTLFASGWCGRRARPRPSIRSFSSAIWAGVTSNAAGFHGAGRGGFSDQP
jgi:hypothetical protein